MNDRSVFERNGFTRGRSIYGSVPPTVQGIPRQSLGTASDSVSDRMNHASITPSIQGTPRRTVGNSGDGSISTVIAKLNVVASQLAANETRFEAQRIQMDEQQTLLDGLQGQSEQIVDLLLRLMQSVESLKDTIQARSQPNGQATAATNTTRQPLAQTYGAVGKSRKVKRPRGRPRVYCVACKKNPVLENSELCGTCHPVSVNIGSGGAMRTFFPGGMWERKRKISLSSLSQGSGQDHDPESQRIENDSSDSDFLLTDGGRPIPNPFKGLLHGKASVHIPRRTSIAGESSSRTMAPTFKGLQKLSQSQGQGSVKNSQTTVRGTPIKTTSALPTNAPFAEDSIPRATGYVDILDPEPFDETSISQSHPQSTSTSVAESISIDALPDEDTEMEEGEVLSQRKLAKKAERRKHLQVLAASKVQHKAKPTSLLPPLQAPAASMKKHNGNTTTGKPTAAPPITAKGDPGRPRKPKANTEPDGDDGHHQLVEKVMGPSWHGVKRKL